MSQQSITTQDSHECYITSLILTLCFVIGLVKFIKLVKVALNPFYVRRLKLHKRYGGGWALITGGSEGIGFSIALELAKEGFDLLLISRSISKLEEAKKIIQSTYPKVNIQYRSMDFQNLQTEEEYMLAFKSILAEKDISLLVNNVGYYLPHRFTANEFKQIRRQMKINILPIAALSRIFIESMKKRQYKSGIINLSSAAATTDFGGASNYSATKTFDDYLSLAVEYELRGKIDILTARPFIVTTPMTRNTDSLIHTSAQKSAKTIVDNLGNSKICYGPIGHSLQGAAVETFNGLATSLAFTNSMQKFEAQYNKKT